MALPWIRIYTETLHDPKLRRLPAVYKWIWVGLLLMAGASEERGVLRLCEGVPYLPEDIADQLGLFDDEKTHVQPALEKFRQLRMIDIDDEGSIYILNFDKRQYDKPSDKPLAVKERVKKHRDKKKESVTDNDCNANETPCNALDKDTDTEIDKENNNSSSEPAGSDTMNEPEKPSKSTRKPKIFSAESDEYRLSMLLRQRIIENDPNAKLPEPSPEGMARWCKDMDLLLRVDKRTPAEVERIISWCQNDQFWKANILSVSKLREKFTTLNLQSTRAGPGRQSVKPVNMAKRDDDKFKLISWGRQAEGGG